MKKTKTCGNCKHWMRFANKEYRDVGLCNGKLSPDYKDIPFHGYVCKRHEFKTEKDD